MSYQPGPEGHAPGYWPPQAPKKSRKGLWITLAIVAVLIVGCAIGSFALLGAGAKSVNDTVKTIQASEEASASARNSDVKITACNLGAGGLATVKFTITNHSKIAQDYAPQFNITDNDGNVYGQTADIVNALPAGKTYHGQAVGTFGDASNGNIKCVLVSA